MMGIRLIHSFDDDSILHSFDFTYTYMYSFDDSMMIHSIADAIAHAKTRKSNPSHVHSRWVVPVVPVVRCAVRRQDTLARLERVHVPTRVQCNLATYVHVGRNSYMYVPTLRVVPSLATGSR